jgi:hypothetical protein
MPLKRGAPFGNINRTVHGRYTRAATAERARRRRVLAAASAAVAEAKAFLRQHRNSQPPCFVPVERREDRRVLEVRRHAARYRSAGYAAGPGALSARQERDDARGPPPGRSPAGGVRSRDPPPP